MRERFDEAFESFLWICTLGSVIAEAAMTLLIYATFPLWVFPYIFFCGNQEPGNEEERK